MDTRTRGGTAAWALAAAVLGTTLGAAPSSAGGEQGWRQMSAGTASSVWIHRGRPGMPTLVYMRAQGETAETVRGTTLASVARGWTVVAPMAIAGLPARQARIAAEAVAGTDPDLLVIRSNGDGAEAALEMARHPHGYLVMTSPVVRTGRLERLVADAARSRGQVVWADGPAATPESGAVALSDMLGTGYRRIQSADGRIGHVGDAITRDKDGFAFGRGLVTARLP